MLATSIVAAAAIGALPRAQAQDMVDIGGMTGHARGHGAMMMFDDAPGHLGQRIDRMLDGLGVTDAQRTQIRQIAMSAAADVRAQREAGRALRDKGMQLFAAPTVDASAAESLRQQMLAQHDQSSKRALQAMLDVSKVLTPEQRAKWVQRAMERKAIMQDRMQRERSAHGMRPRQP